MDDLNLQNIFESEFEKTRDMNMACKSVDKIFSSAFPNSSVLGKTWTDNRVANIKQFGDYIMKKFYGTITIVEAKTKLSCSVFDEYCKIITLERLRKEAFYNVSERKKLQAKIITNMLLATENPIIISVSRFEDDSPFYIDIPAAPYIPFSDVFDDNDKIILNSKTMNWVDVYQNVIKCLHSSYASILSSENIDDIDVKTMCVFVQGECIMAPAEFTAALYDMANAVHGIEQVKVISEKGWDLAPVLFVSKCLRQLIDIDTSFYGRSSQHVAITSYSTFIAPSTSSIFNSDIRALMISENDIFAENQTKMFSMIFNFMDVDSSAIAMSAINAVLFLRYALTIASGKKRSDIEKDIFDFGDEMEKRYTAEYSVLYDGFFNNENPWFLNAYLNMGLQRSLQNMESIFNGFPQNIRDEISSFTNKLLFTTDSEKTIAVDTIERELPLSDSNTFIKKRLTFSIPAAISNNELEYFYRNIIALATKSTLAFKCIMFIRCAHISSVPDTVYGIYWDNNKWDNIPEEYASDLYRDDFISTLGGDIDIPFKYEYLLL